MHGGTYDAARSYGDTWEWTAREGWRRFAGAGPGTRDHTQMSYDPDRGRAVLFGGSATAESAFGDTWEFDGTRWERVATAGPPPRVHHAMQYDPSVHRVVLFGGFTPNGASFGDTWAWDGSRWTPIARAITPRSHARMAFSSAAAIAPARWRPEVQRVRRTRASRFHVDGDGRGIGAERALPARCGVRCEA